MVKPHRNGILAQDRRHLATGFVEGTDSLIQSAKGRACGYHYMIITTYLLAVKLPLRTITLR